MTVQFYTDIETRLTAKIAWFSWFKLFNNQFEEMERREEQTFPNLSIFMEFLSPVNIITLGSGCQLYDCTVRFHLYFITYELQDLQILQYKQELHRALQGFFPTRSSSLNKINEEPDQNHNDYIIWKLDYATQIPDEDGSAYYNVIDATKVETIGLDLTGTI